MELLKDHRIFFDSVRKFSSDERQKLQNSLDVLRRSQANRTADMKPYIFYIRQIAGEYEEINGKVRSVDHIERTEDEKECLLLLASFADLREDRQQDIINQIERNNRIA